MSKRRMIEAVAIRSSESTDAYIGDRADLERATLVWIAEHTDGEDWTFRLPQGDVLASAPVSLDALVEANMNAEADVYGLPVDASAYSVCEALMKSPPPGCGVHVRSRFSWKRSATRFGQGRIARVPLAITSPDVPPMHFEVRGTRVVMGESARVSYDELARVMGATRAARKALRARKRPIVHRPEALAVIAQNALSRPRTLTVDVDAVAAALAVSGGSWADRPSA